MDKFCTILQITTKQLGNLQAHFQFPYTKSVYASNGDWQQETCETSIATMVMQPQQY